MNWINHFLFSFNLLYFLFGNSVSLKKVILFSIFFGLLIDLDVIIKYLLGHRGNHLRTWIQEPFGLILIGLPIALILSYFYGRIYLFLVIIPYASHIFLDYLVIHSVSPFAPFSDRKINTGFIGYVLPNKIFLNFSSLDENWILLMNLFIFLILIIF